MKTLLALAAACAATVTVSAQEKMEAQQIQKAVPLLLGRVDKLTGLQFKVDPDREKGDGLQAGGAAALVLPARGLTAEKLEKAGKDVVPVGQIYFKGLAPAKNGKPTDNDRMHILMIEDGGKAQRIWLCLLGARKNGEKLELVVYGSEKTPIIQVAMRKFESATDAPIEISGEKQDDQSGNLTLSILGKYKASFVVMKQEE